MYLGIPVSYTSHDKYKPFKLEDNTFEKLVASTKSSPMSLDILFMEMHMYVQSDLVNPDVDGRINTNLDINVWEPICLLLKQCHLYT